MSSRIKIFYFHLLYNYSADSANIVVASGVQEDVQSHTTDDELSDDMPPHNRICMHGNALRWEYYNYYDRLIHSSIIASP